MRYVKELKYLVRARIREIEMETPKSVEEFEGCLGQLKTLREIHSYLNSQTEE